MKTYYAIRWVYGRAVNSNTGRPLGTYHAFTSKADRALWVDDASTPYMSQGGARETVTLRAHGSSIRYALSCGEVTYHDSYADECAAWKNYDIDRVY